jgi:predicted transcriptional regulator
MGQFKVEKEQVMKAVPPPLADQLVHIKLTCCFQRVTSRIDSLSAVAENARDMNTSRFLLRGFRRPREIACFALGKLERQVLEETWRLGEVTVRDIHRAFDERVAYTTLMTTLDRLFKKNLLARRKDGRAFLYAARVSREDLDRGIKEDVVDGLLGQGADGVEPILACIVDTISERDRELLDELDRLVQEKKREIRKRD